MPDFTSSTLTPPTNADPASVLAPALPEDSPPPSPFGKPDPVDRTYVMLEKVRVIGLIADAVDRIESNRNVESYSAAELIEALIEHFGEDTTYVPLGDRDARNAEHAYRQILAERFGDGPGTLDLVAVATKMWKPKSPKSNVRHYVSM